MKACYKSQDTKVKKKEEEEEESKEELAHREVRYKGRILCHAGEDGAWGSSALSRRLTLMSY